MSGMIYRRNIVASNEMKKVLKQRKIRAEVLE